MKTGILIVNTGSPEAPQPHNVKKYLGEFLMDERVIDIPFMARWFLVNVIIAPFRSKKTAQLYQNIWTPEGSPLLVYTRKLAKEITKTTRLPVEYAMRYGNPSIRESIEKLSREKTEKIILIPMFPHYAMSTYESVVEKTKMEIAKFSGIKLEVIKPYYNNPEFIQALYDNSRAYLKKKFDHIIFSYHSLPLRHIKKADSDGNICLVKENCCEVYSTAHEKCYKAQTLQTTKLFLKKAGLDFAVNSDMASLTYQSAMGKDWLQPSTENKIMELAHNGYKKILVICPGFVTDNLETIEELGIRAKNTFISIALEEGKNKPEYTLVSSLNLHKAWIKALSKWIKNAAKK
ncbi:MAG: ferrochelatase [Spirochaetia bacterium]|nr:ferrochelatase [Spirochaetia bacterium]